MAPILRDHYSAAIVSIGDELTLGQTLDTNSRWLSQRLADAGVRVREHLTVPDDLPAIVGALERLARSVDLILVTGGLGPTADDLTRQALAQAMGDTLIEDQAAAQHLREWFAGRPMRSTNLVQALRPSRGQLLPNPNGTAPGLLGSIRHADGRTSDAFCLPGPPREMQPMFLDHVLTRLRVPAGRAVVTRVMPTFGLGESEVARRLAELMDRDRAERSLPLVGTTASQGVVSIRVRAEGDRSDAQQSADQAAAECRARVGAEWILGEGELSLAACVLELLRERGHTLALAESCTGGLLGSMLTDAPGASDALWGGWITYANSAKVDQLAMPDEILAAHGAVSAACARAMADGALRRSQAHHALAITGIAGPGGGSESKPVGTVWVALASRNAPTTARRFALAGDRTNVRIWAAQAALGLLRLRMIGREDLALLRQVEVA